ncbi:hypothetical protein [Actinomadura sp. 9N215]|uniref:hypothetical protein n=1 Tax=Actinomadura sp. 9N215 TaxID=3375150 RepID=UPI0037B58BA6
MVGETVRIAVEQLCAHGCGCIVRILFIPELIPTSGREVIVLHARTGENSCCVDLLFPHLKDVQVDGVTESEDGDVVTALVIWGSWLT